MSAAQFSNCREKATEFGQSVVKKQKGGPRAALCFHKD
ncbi:hypothetical protein SJ05684_c27520 [Sinorhizobium sojae CCBAU 05684]|uniref:Uncharacterized protein n=1 Tax=Sinorhizobium sojae CCBAU 05684 TaxID=716928 RepID=A0A249PE17_9HYPH|nr:hypothetical protein SJ05684_c27520 [Sinorhizobium sojae CCBAU 05684]